jgi:hypothetical protein
MNSTAFRFFLSVSIIILAITFSKSFNGGPDSWRHFKIKANVSDELFGHIQTELGIKEKDNTYELLVNISDKIAQNQYIEYISNTGAKQRFSWYDLSEGSQNKLIEFTGANKTNLGQANESVVEYFRILVYTSDDPVFLKIQKELLPDEKPLESYTLVVNLSKTNPAYHYVAFGNDVLPATKKYMWADLSMDIQKKLIEWNGGNKIKIE